LRDINEKIDDFLETSAEEPRDENEANDRIKVKQDLVQRIDSAIFRAGDYYRRDSLRLKAIQELRKQFESFVKLEIVAKGISQVKEVLKTLFEALEILDDNSYRKYRDRAITLNPVTRGLFLEYEAAVEQPIKPEEVHIINSDQQNKPL
jgi:hypothetical protein